MNRDDLSIVGGLLVMVAVAALVGMMFSRGCHA